MGVPCFSRVRCYRPRRLRKRRLPAARTPAPVRGRNPHPGARQARRRRLTRGGAPAGVRSLRRDGAPRRTRPRNRAKPGTDFLRRAFRRAGSISMGVTAELIHSTPVRHAGLCVGRHHHDVPETCQLPSMKSIWSARVRARPWHARCTRPQPTIRPGSSWKALPAGRWRSITPVTPAFEELALAR